MEHLTAVFTHLVERAGYLGLFFVMMLGNIGVPVGTELIVPTAGALAAKGLLNVWVAAGVATLGEIAGAGVLYAIGFFGGRPFVARWGKYVGVSMHKLDTAHAFYERHGRKTVFISRFIPVIRGIASLPAGISRMQKRYFFPYTTAGSLIFCFALAQLGSSLGKHFDEIAPYLHKATIAVLILLALAVAGIFLARKQRASTAVSPRKIEG
jgi:membrane protein DedA with SNARE-associated domain